MRYRILTLLLAALMLTTVFVGCKEPSELPDETTPSGETTPEETTPPETTVDTTPVFVDKNYGGATFTVFQRNREGNYGGMYIYPGEDITNPMEAATYERNLALEEKYGIKLEFKEAGNPTDQVSRLINSGDVTFDVILDQRLQTALNSKKGILYDWNKIQNISWDRSWWDKNVKEGYSINDKLYYAVNDISVGNLEGVRFLYYNKKLQKDFGLKDPQVLVEQDKWVLDEYLAMVKSISVDNGDGVWNGYDTYGMLGELSRHNGNIMYFLAGVGVKYLEIDNNGNFYTNAYNDRMQTIAAKIRDVFVDKHYVCYYGEAVTDDPSSGKITYSRNVLFPADHFLFVQTGMKSSIGFKDMASDYGVAPNPKADESQDRYYHKMDKYQLIWSIPNYESVDYDRLGIIMEYWSYMSSLTVMPAYYETTIQTKIMRNPKDTEMLDLIKATTVYDLGELFGADIMEAIYNGYEKETYASEWESAKSSIDEQLSKLTEQFRMLE